jgi:mRNA interferase MazF
MEIARGEVWWADLPDPTASSPGGAHPVLVVQTNAFNRSRIATVIVAVITSNLRLAEAPGNVLLGPKEAGLKKPSVVNVSQVVTADKTFLHSRAGRVRSETMAKVEQGLRLILNL